ncbi:MAG TPA: hypothetical protein VJ142_02640 [Candidatus Nanoarchaeia archaeon]|nr:hypothetical protein [Candidatus Nanoarchaeia archaeon]
MTNSELQSKRYEVSGIQIRDIAESYAWLALLYDRLQRASDPQKRVEIAKSVINEALPLYNRVLPKNLDYLPRQLVNPDALERTCKEILSQSR